MEWGNLAGLETRRVVVGDEEGDSRACIWGRTALLFGVLTPSFRDITESLNTSSKLVKNREKCCGIWL